jgi:Carboxypeptidase regulatory-like domain
MKIPVLALAVVLAASLAQAQGGIAGCVTDRSGGALPGVEIVASDEAGARKIVTQASGCYELEDLTPGTYSVTATLAGFITAKRDGVVAVSDRTIGRVDFALCVAPADHVDWVSFGGVEEAWKKADAVVDVRITGSGPVAQGECPSRDFMQTAVVIEVLKNASSQPLGDALLFRKTYWASESLPYPIGQEMVMFLSATPNGFGRLAGPTYVWLFDGNSVLNPFGPSAGEGATPASFLARLRELARHPQAPAR